jgi:predicted small lipoprotein YifL
MINSLKILIILSLFMLFACGMQGDLYLPDTGPDKENSAQTGK